MSVQFDDLPGPIQRKMLLRQYENTGTMDPDIFRKEVSADTQKGGFNWAETPESDPYWNEILVEGHFPEVEEASTISKEELAILFRNVDQGGRNLIASVVEYLKISDGEYLYPPVIRANVEMYINS